MSKSWDVVVLGATGLVGDMMIQVLQEREFPVRELFPLASSRSAGKTVQFAGRHVRVTDVEKFDFSRAQLGEAARVFEYSEIKLDSLFGV